MALESIDSMELVPFTREDMKSVVLQAIGCGGVMDTVLDFVASRAQGNPMSVPGKEKKKKEKRKEKKRGGGGGGRLFFFFF